MLTFWNGLPYKTTGSILRAIRAGLASAIGILIAANASGTLVPENVAPFVAVLVTSFLLGADKYIREWRIEDKEEAVVEDVVDAPIEDAPAEEADPPIDEDEDMEPEDDTPIVADPIDNVDIPVVDAELETGLTGD